MLSGPGSGTGCGADVPKKSVDASCGSAAEPPDPRPVGLGAGHAVTFQWVEVLGPLTSGQDLTTDQAAAAMTDILSGNATSAQIAAFIVALRIKGETVEEMAGLVTAMQDACESVTLASLDAVIDTCGTGGDRSHSINVSTIAAFVVAGAGARVCKHGNRAASSACGSADLLEALGVTIDLPPEAVARCVEEAGIGFCFAPRLPPALRPAVAAP